MDGGGGEVKVRSTPPVMPGAMERADGVISLAKMLSSAFLFGWVTAKRRIT